MKKALLFGTLVLLVAQAVFAQWTLGPTSEPMFRFWRFDGEYYPPTSKVYFLGGRLPDGTTSGEIYSFNPDSGTFADEMLAMETPISNYKVNLLNDPTGPDSLALYTVGGRNAGGTMIAALQVFYPISGLAMSLTSDPFPGRIGGQMFIPAMGNAVVNNKLYVFGGYETVAAPYNTDSTWVYDPALPAGTRWSNITTARLSERKGYVTAAVVDGKIYGIGGNWTPNGAVPLYNSMRLERFDPANPGAGWVRLADAPDSIAESQAFGFNTNSPYGHGGHIIVVPHCFWGDPIYPECYDYNTATNTWTTFPSNINVPRRDHAGFFVPGNRGSGGIPGMWIFGGRKSGAPPETMIAYSTEYYQLTVGVEEQGGVRLVKKTALEQAAPNPFSGRTVLRYSLAKSGPVSLAIYGITGQKVRTLVSENASAGTHEVAWDGRDAFGKAVGAGVYFARFAAEKVHSTERITVLR